MKGSLKSPRAEKHSKEKRKVGKSGGKTGYRKKAI